MKRRIALLAGAGLFFYLLFLALTLPASAIFRWVLPANGNIAIVAPQGTPWSGEARALVVDGAALGRVSWSIHFWPLFLGRLDYDLHVHGTATDLTGEAVIKPGGAIALQNVDGQLDLATLLPWFGLPAASAGGRVQLAIDRLILDHNRPTALDGRITVDHVQALWPQPMPLGGYVAIFTTGDKGIRASARDTGGPIRLNGNLSVDGSGRYQASGTLAARTGADANLKQALRFLGTTDTAGTTHFRYSGSLKL